MPFRPELHYFYLYLKKHIEERYDIDCERGDAQVLTKPLLEKIADYIKRADVIIADCTGQNASVFYELGFAHALEKKVILLSQDDEAAIDIRHFEFIAYRLADHTAFLARIDNAINNVFAERYDDLYNRARQIFNRFREETKANVREAPRETFISRVSDLVKTADVATFGDEYTWMGRLLPRIIESFTDVAQTTQMVGWLNSKKPPADPQS